MFKHHHENVHGHHHGITAAVVLAALLLTLTDVHGQTTLGAGAMFQGRPEMAGAQGGLGAQAGPPTGGIGLQGSEGAEKGLNLRKPSGLDTMGKPSNDSIVAPAPGHLEGNSLLKKEQSLVGKSDSALARDETSVVKKTRRAAKRTVQRTRHGVAPIDAHASIN